MAEIRWEHAAVTGLALVGALFLFGALRSAGGIRQPSSTTESGWNIADPQQPNLEPGVVTPGLIFTPHRYPRVCGGELTTVIHYGHSRLAVPHERDTNWITCPPSELTI